MRFLKRITVPTAAEQLENEDKPFIAVWYDGNGTTEERVTRARALELAELAEKGEI